MQIKREITVGSKNKGDIKVTIIPSNEKLKIQIASTHGKLFYNQISKCIEQVINEFGIINGIIKIVDQGAFDYVIKARLTSALHKSAAEIEKKFYTEKPKIQYKLRRTRMYIPGNNPYLFRGISYYKADAIILDLEDSVPIEEKDSARELVFQALLNIDFQNSEKMVRINPTDVCGYEDIETLIMAKPDMFLIPKCESEYDIKKVLEIVEKIEKKNQIKNNFVKLAPIIESAKGLENIYEILTATDRIDMVAFGAEDYTASLGIKKTKEENELDYARWRIINAAKACNIQASDTVFSDIEDTQGLIQSTKKIKAMGYDGKGVIHPSQIDIIHSIFNPKEDEINFAKDIIKVYNEARESGSGVVKYKGKMIDLPVILKAKRILSIYEAMQKEGEI